jgi:hypothetical protein
MNLKFDGLSWLNLKKKNFQFHPLILIWLRIKLHDLLYLFSIRLSWSYDPRIDLNGLTWIDSGCFLCPLFNWFFFQFYHSIFGWLGIEFHNLFCFVFLWEYLNLEIKVTSFDILTLVKSSFFFIFFLRDYISLMTRVTGPSTLDLFFIRLSPSYDLSRKFDRLTHLT